MVKNSDKEKYLYRSYGIAFDGKGEWSFGKDHAKNVIIFGVDNSSSPHNDNPKNVFLILVDGPTFSMNGGFGASEKKNDSNFSKAKTKFCLNVHYNANNSYFCKWKKHL